MENIKNYLIINEKQVNKKVKTTQNDYTYKLSYNNHIDFIVDKLKNGKLYKQFVVIPSEKLMYIREKNGDNPVTNQTISAFFREIEKEDMNTMLRNVNEFYIVKSYDKKYDKLSMLRNIWGSKMSDNQFKYELIKRGICPPRYGNEDIYMENIDLFLKLYKKIQEENVEINSNMFLTLFKISKLINYNNTLYIIDKCKNSEFRFYLSDWSCHHNESVFCNLINRYNLDFKTFVNYLFDNLYFQGVGEFTNDILKIYEDYLHMQLQMYGKIKDKYPDSLKMAHDKLIMKYNLHKKYYDDKIIKINKEKLNNLTYQDENYVISIPESSQDIIDEGVNLHHCVGSYVERVKNGKTNILFMRKVESPEESLITIEYKVGVLIMIRGLLNRYVNEEEKEFIKKWAKLKNIYIEDNTCI